MNHASLIRQMTLKEKCAILSGRDVWHTRAVERLNIPSISLSDGPSGLRKQAGAGDHLGLNASVPATCIPSAATVANSWDPGVAEQVGAVIGSEAAAQDVQVLLGPGLNTKRNPLCGRNFEYFSEDPYLSGKLAAGFIRGVQSRGVSACAKHFAANSQELRRMHSDSVMDERTLRELYLTNFEIAVKEGQPRTIMTSYNRLNGTYTNESAHLLQDILRGEWGYTGAVVTDWGGSNDYTSGVRAGMNLEMPAAGDDSAIQLMRAVRENRIAESVVDERVDQLLDLVDATMATRNTAPADMEANHRTALRAAEASAVLLKNDNALLPLDGASKIALIGDFAAAPRFQGAGSSMVNPYKVDSLTDLAGKYLPGLVGTAQGYERNGGDNDALAQEALKLAEQADTVIYCIGLTESYETEGLDRTHLRVPDNQVRLLEKLAQVNRRVVIVLMAGSAVEMPWLEHGQALLYAGLCGQAGAEALLRILTGAVNPSGKLAETFPETLADVPSSKWYPGEELTSEYREGLYVGYRAFDRLGRGVRFPFGYGLSYTTFEYAGLSVTEEGVSFSLTNTGKTAGAEIAQLYVALPGAKIFRPEKELKGFTKVALAPGETRRVTIPFDDKTFRYFNVKTGRWEIEGGTYEVRIGAGSADIRLTGTLAVKGTGAPDPYAGLPIDCYRTGNVTDVPDESFRALLGRAIPTHTWDRGAPLGMNDTISQLSYAKNPLARLAGRILENKKNKSLAAGKPDLNLLFICNMPFRGIGKMMNGMVSMEMAEAILFMANGHGFRGFGRLVKGFFRKPNLEKAK